jgi:hypothetical protein
LDSLVPSDGLSSQPYSPSAPTLFDEGLPTESGFALIRGDNTSTWYAATPNLYGSENYPNFQIVGPTGSNFSTTGSWQSTTDAGYYYPGLGYDFPIDNYPDFGGSEYTFAGGSDLYADADDNSTAAWQISDLEPQQMVQVFVAWDADGDRTDDAQ